LPAHTTARILTVDDNPIVRADLRLILESAGFDVCPEARDGVEAVELAHTHQPDLILIDLQLPELDGVAATREILDRREVPIVALTGHANRGLVQRAIEAGAVAHVLKPFHEGQLVDTVEGALAAFIPRVRRDAWALAEEDRNRQFVLVESMVRAGRPGMDISAALRRRPRNYT
jgi:two-component system, response regulator PdtaR